jgi:transcriptional regulator with PAS, ATPase and Fis domain
MASSGKPDKPDKQQRGGAPVVGHATISAPIRDHLRHGGPVVALRAVGTGELIPISPSTPSSIGSSAGCDVVLDDPTVSRMHCLLERRAEGVFVRDLGSKNGTFINGNRIESAELRAGGELKVGGTSLIAVATGLDRRSALEQLRGSDPSFRTAVDTALRAAASECTVLVLGETGTGKELIARAVHEASPRAAQPFAAVNCAAIAHDLAGSELFGHVRGAFTGAVAPRDGLFVHAEGGTVFLDEVGELPQALQSYLLRVIETRRVRPVGGTDERAINVRLVAATHRVAALGTSSSPIRVDLYHRLAVVVVTLPPLRERIGDLREIVPAILDELATEFGHRTLSRRAWEAMGGHAWPGNVRELRHRLTRAVALGGAELGPLELFPDMRAAAPARTRTPPLAPPPVDGRDRERLRLPPDEPGQRRAMAAALARSRSIREAAQLIGMPKSTFAEKALGWGLLDRRRSENTDSGDGET